MNDKQYFLYTKLSCQHWNYNLTVFDIKTNPNIKTYINTNHDIHTYNNTNPYINNYPDISGLCRWLQKMEWYGY